MKLRDDKALFREALALIQSAADGNDTTPYITGRVLDAVELAYADAPSPETGTAAVPTDVEALASEVMAGIEADKKLFARHEYDPAPAPEPVKPPWLLSVVELAAPLTPGAQISVEGEMVAVYEVRRLASLSTPIAGERRPLFAVLHAGHGSALVAVCLHGEQEEWPPRTPAAEPGKPATEEKPR